MRITSSNSLPAKRKQFLEVNCWQIATYLAFPMALCAGIKLFEMEWREQRHLHVIFLNVGPLIHSAPCNRTSCL